MIKMSKYKGDIMLLIASAIGGTGFVFIKYLLEWQFTAFHIIAVRFLVATILLFVLYHKEIKNITKKEWQQGSILGLLVFLLFVLLIMGLRYTTPSVNAFLSCLQAVIVPFMLWGIFHTKPDNICFIAALLAMIGVAFLSDADTSNIKGGIGMLLSFGSSVAFAFQMILMDRFLKESNALHLALIEDITVLVLALLLSFIEHVSIPTITFSAVVYFLFLGVFCTGIYFVLQSLGQKLTKPSNAAIILTSESVFASITAAILYGERLSLKGYAGCAIIFCAVLLAERKQS